MISEREIEAFQASDEQLDKLLEMGQFHCDQWIGDDPACTDMSPHLIVHARDAAGELKTTMIAAHIDFNTGLEKKLAMMRFGAMFYRKREVPVALAFTSEAWTASAKPDEPRKFLLPEDSPDRREAVIVVVGDIGCRRFRHARRFVARRANGTMQLDGGWETANAGRFPILGHFWAGFFEQLPDFHEWMQQLRAEHAAKGGA